MKIYFYISVAASALSLVLSIVLCAVGSTNQSLQTDAQNKQVELQAQQEEINKGTTIQQKIGPSLLNDMAVVSATDEKMRALLANHGYKVNTPAPGASPAPGAPAPAKAPEKAPEAPALRP